MPNKLSKVVETVYLPAIKQVIPRPARYIVSYRVVAASAIYRTKFTQLNPNPREQLTFDLNRPTYPGASSNIIVPDVWERVYVTTEYVLVREVEYLPPIEGHPGRDSSYEPAPPQWDSGAESIAVIVGDFLFEFDFGDGAVGALCGVAPVGAHPSAFNAVSHGLLSDGDQIWVVEGGVRKASTPHVAGIRPSIRRVGSQVRYIYGGWEYESAEHTTAPVQVAARLYSISDFVDNPAIHPLVLVASDIEWGWLDLDSRTAIVARVPWGWEGSVTSGDGYTYVNTSLDVVASDYAMGWGTVDVGGALVVANDDPWITVSGITNHIPLTVLGNGVAVLAGEINTDVGAPYLRASDYSTGEAVFPAVEVFAGARGNMEAPGTGNAAELISVADAYTTDPIIYASIADTLRVGDHVDVLMALDAGLVEYLVAGDGADATMVLEALLASTIRVSDNAGAVRAAVLQYATNLMTGAVGRYDGFDFSGFIKSGMDTYGWKRDGLYRLGYAEDTGEKIQAMIEFAAEDFDTTSRKSIRALFFGIDTDGALYARLVDDNDCDATYRVIPHGGTQRANPAQRPTSRFWRLRLEIVEATFADLDNVEWKAATTGRRTRS